MIFEMDAMEAMDIDEETDFLVAETLYKLREEEGERGE
jgi:CMP-N-acetylneuraminic acid synthetase